MPSYTPTTLPATGTFDPETLPVLIVDSIYGALGGTYGVSYWDYGGFQVQFTPESDPTPGAYVPE